MFWNTDLKFRNWLPKLQAHRGHWIDGLTQNSLDSIQSAFKLNYEMVEFDVRLTADNVVVLFHDDAIENQEIKSLSFKKLHALKPVNTLTQVLTWLSAEKNKNLKLNIEFKSKLIFGFKLEKMVSQLINQFGVSEQVMVSSFNPLSLARFRFFSPQVYRGLIQTFEDYPENNWFVRARVFNLLCRPHALHLRYEDWTAAKYLNLNKKIPVVLWTLNDLGLYSKINNQIAGAISDRITPLDLAVN
ncbi:MAG: glycerophosphodiester phosphodiesterase [Bdellovibrio sp.]|nr:glycerophosphodiester phosphodiesterase [Bdellovibrio sp.]